MVLLLYTRSPRSCRNKPKFSIPAFMPSHKTGVRNFWWKRWAHEVMPGSGAKRRELFSAWSTDTNSTHIRKINLQLFVGEFWTGCFHLGFSSLRGKAAIFDSLFRRRLYNCIGHLGGGNKTEMPLAKRAEAMQIAINSGKKLASISEQK